MEDSFSQASKKKQFGKIKLPKKAVKRRFDTNETSPTSHSKKKIQVSQSRPLVLAPDKEKNKSTPLVLAPKRSKKTSRIVPKVKLQDQCNSEINVSVQELEKQFNIRSKDVENAVKGVIKFASNNPHLQNQLFNEEIPLFLQINSFKIPKTKGPVKQLFRVPMDHSILPSDADICLIVPDVKGIKNNEHKKHLEHYENLLRSKDVTGIKKIMTFHEFRTEYDTFELKHRLVDLYDAFLVDGRISGKVVHKCGSIFYNKRKVPIAVKLYLPKLKSHIDQTLKKAFLHLNLKSDSHIVQIGHSQISTVDLIENVYSVIKFLDKQFPGKMDNIRSLNVYAHRGSSIPIYISLRNPNDITVPLLSNKKPKAYKSFSGELTTQYNADVVVRPSGKVIVRRSKVPTGQNNKNPDDDITDAEILRENKKVDQLEQQNGDNKGKKSGKKRKLSLSESDGHQVIEENNPVQSEQTGPKKKKKKKPPTNLPAKQKIGDHGAGQSKADKKSKKKDKKHLDENNGENITLNKGKTSTNNKTQNIKKKTKIVVTKIKTFEKGSKKIVKRKIKKKTRVAK